MVHKQDKATLQPAEATMMTRKPRSAWLGRRALMLGVIFLIIIGAGLFWFFKPSHTNDKTVNEAELQTLQTSLGLALNENDDQTVVEVTTQLIDGAKSNRFAVANTTLAQYDLDKATSLFNLKQYAQAIPLFEAAPKLDNSTRQAALQGEVEASYNAGQRQQLVPLFQQLIKLSQNSGDQRGGSAANYQHDIQALQHNQGIELQ